MESLAHLAGGLPAEFVFSSALVSANNIGLRPDIGGSLLEKAEGIVRGLSWNWDRRIDDDLIRSACWLASVDIGAGEYNKTL